MKKSLIRAVRPALLITLVATLSIATGLSGGAPASAATLGVNDIASLQTAITNGDDPQLTADISDAAATITVSNSVTVDLNGKALVTDSVLLDAGVELTIIDSNTGGSWTVAASTDGVAAFRTSNATLTIESGTVTATGGLRGAGIGGSTTEDGGTLNITGGTVVATGNYSAAIGGGYHASGGAINISGGTVTANGDGIGAGIGGGGSGTYEGDGGTIAISGGTVLAFGGSTSAGIGGGFLQPGGNIHVSGASTVVTVTTGYYSAGIGGGRDGAGGTITIDNGTVSVSTAPWAETGAAIGGGERGAGGTITINGGTVTADSRRPYSRSGAAGIGSGDASMNNSGQSGIVTGTTEAAGIITINGGIVKAYGSGGAAGIGGGELVDGWNTTINGGTVTAVGGDEAAGIGGGNRGDGGIVTINGGTVTATGGDQGAGIGGGHYGAGGTLTITSNVSAANVTAHSPYFAAAIGSGQSGGAAVVDIGVGTIVTADAETWATALGRGTDGAASTWTLAGELRLPNADSHIDMRPGDSGTVTSTGKITGTGSVGVYSGATLTNNGIITNASVGPQNLITNHSYPFEFDGNFAGATAISPVEVYAPSFADGARALPTPTRPGLYLGGWNTASDGSGTNVTSTSTITAGGTLYAQWTLDSLTVTPASPTVTAGDSIQFVVRDDSSTDVTAVSTLTTNVASDVVDGTTDGLLHFTEAGTHTISAVLDADSSAVGRTTITVVADTANPTALVATPSATLVATGGSITFAFTLLDPYGNAFPAGSGVTLVSDHPSDIIVGNTVTFPSASTHIFTATLGSFSTTASITVRALAATGVDPLLPLGTAVFAVLLGVALLRRKPLFARR